MKRGLSSFLQLRFNTFVYQRLGWRFVYCYIAVLGRLYFFLNRKEKRRIGRSVEDVFKGRKNRFEIGVIKRGVIRGIIFHYYEKLFNAYEDIERLRSFFEKSVDSAYFYKLDDALKKKKGLLFVTGHYGGIEFIPIMLALRGYPISVIAKFKTKALKDDLYLKTRDLGLRIIDANEKTSILNVVLRELRRNRIVFTECDEIEEWKPSPSEKMIFLGKWIGVDRTISLIQRRTGAEIVFGLLRRFTISRYSLILQNYQDMVSKLGEAPSSVGETILKYFERHIYSSPEEWYQWKNYPLIAGAPVSGATVREKPFVPILKPVFDKA